MKFECRHLFLAISTDKVASSVARPAPLSAHDEPNLNLPQRVLTVLQQFCFFAVCSSAIFGVPAAFAEDPRGLEIARNMREHDRGFGNFIADMEMVLLDSSGKETAVRRLRIKTLEVPGDGDKNLAIFDAPADVKGTAFLNHTHIGKPDDQWLYLPALKRVKRIAPANKTAPFMGSEFSYEDLTSFETEKYAYKYVGEETFGDRPCFLLERYPVDRYSGYSRLLSWVDRDRYVMLKVEFYDRKGEKLKTLVSSGFEKFLKRYWRAKDMRMVNHVSGKSSLLHWENYRFRQDIRERDFEPSSLSRAR